ncbi:MAG: TonB-dependent receptor [Ignavibacteriales bacterium]|nr:TonB-dependent receptor [Ignavibacteriales bacterium]
MRCIQWIVVFSVFFGGSLVAHPTFVGKVSGIVLDAETAEPLVGVNVYLPALRKGSTTDLHGYYEIGGLHEGVYTLRFSYVGYATAAQTVTLIDRDVDLNVQLRPSILQLPSITVTGKPQATDILLAVQSTDVLEDHDLARLRGQTIGATLSHLPGVSSMTTGNAISKPVIRGLSSQRVVIVSDGVRQEGQQWADEHAPEIDVYEADKIEVVRGPGSLLYGSDALGGVVNVVFPDLPRSSQGVTSLDSRLTLNGFSNSSQMSGALSMSGASGIWGYRGSVSMRGAGDIRTPKGILRNSAASELNGSGTFGLTQRWGFLSATASRFSTKLEIHENPAIDPDATPFQRIIHDKVAVHLNAALEGIRLETVGGWQRNNRREFEEHDAPDPELELVTETWSLDLRGHHRPLGSLFGTVGISLLHQNVDSRREEKLVPNSTTFDAAGFLYEELALGALSLSGGARYDHRTISIQQSNELGIEGRTLTYRAVSTSFGGTFRPTDMLALIASIGTGWRSPTSFELFADGVHEGTATYEIGNADVVPERSLSVDLGMRYVAPSLVVQTTLFVNTITDYIFSFPTGQIDSASTFPVYRFNQANARLQGLEVSANIQLATWWQLQLLGDIVQGNNRATGSPLPLIPAPKMSLESQVEADSWGPLTHLHANVKITVVASQTRVTPPETPTGGYTLVDCSVGFEFPFVARTAMLHLGVENVFNRAHVNHLNRYKAFALNPGRNITARLTIPFSIL